MNHSGYLTPPPHTGFIISTTVQIKSIFVSMEYIQIRSSIYLSVCVMKTKRATGVDRIYGKSLSLSHTHTHTHTVNLIQPCVEGGFWGSLSLALKGKKRDDGGMKWEKKKERKENEK